MRLFVLSTVPVLAAGCSASTAPIGESLAPARPFSGFVAYKHGQSINVTTSIQPTDIGASGNVTLKQNIDDQDLDWDNPQQNNVMRMGVRESGTGTLSINYPWDEHATIIKGQLTLTLMSTGQQYTLNEGDSYLVSQNTPFTWTANQPTQISFGDRKGLAGTFSGLKVMPAGVQVISDLVPLPPPEVLGGTVLSGGPVQLSAVLDFVADVNAVQAHAIGSIFEATSGDIDVHLPFTEHVGIVWKQVKVSLPNGVTITLDPGDSAFVKQDTNILWSVSDADQKVQESFLARFGIECAADTDCQLAQDWITCGCMGLPNSATAPGNSCPKNIRNVCSGKSAVCDMIREACIAVPN